MLSVFLRQTTVHKLMKRRTHKRTMAELRWIQTCLSLILGLQVTAVTGQSSSPPPSSPSITVRAGDDVTLSCTKVIDGQHECNSTDWYFSGSTDTKLVGGGRIVVEDKSTSDRLRVSETCSLVLKNVSAEDAGRFECQQISSGKRYHYTHVFLSVVSMTEQEVGEDVTLTCSVSSYGDCKDKVRWLFKGNPVDKGHRELKTSQSGCSATVSFLKTHFSSNELDNFKCEVMNSSSGNKQQFTFSPRSSGKKGSSSGDKETTSDKTTGGSWWSIIAMTSAALILTVVVLFIIRRKRRRNNGRKTAENKAEESVSYTSITLPPSCSNTVRGGDDTVIYSMANAPSDDPPHVYATIN